MTAMWYSCANVGGRGSGKSCKTFAVDDTFPGLLRVNNRAVAELLQSGSRFRTTDTKAA
jgi:hypothetical protein